MHEVVDFVYSGYRSLFAKIEDFNEIGSSIPLPHFMTSTLKSLCLAAIDIFLSEDTVLKLDGDFVVVGDIHGSFHDLIQIFQKFGPDQKYLFLGDYVDRGPFSLECITLLLALKCRDPDKIFLIRGNHETADVSSKYGFQDEVLKQHDETVFSKFMDVFACLPLAAVINNEAFCVHGGISQYLTTISQIDEVTRPLLEEEMPVFVKQMLWSDPSAAIHYFQAGNRGAGLQYGDMAVKDFLAQNGLKYMVRGHECVDKGYFWHSGMPVVTVFSASRYSEGRNNVPAVLTVTIGAKKGARLPLMPKMEREKATFFTMKITMNRRDSWGLCMGANLYESQPVVNRTPMVHVSAKKGKSISALSSCFLHTSNRPPIIAKPKIRASGTLSAIQCLPLTLGNL